MLLAARDGHEIGNGGVFDAKRIWSSILWLT